MSYFDGPNKGYGWAAGHFLVDDENCVRQTMTIAADHSQVVTRDDGRKVVPAGAVIPSNDGNAKGILYEDIDVTNGAHIGSVVVAGTVYEDKLPAAIESAAEAVLTEIVVITTSPATTRPDYGKRTFANLGVASAEGSAAGKTAITVTGYTKESTDVYKYKTASSVDVPALGQPLPAGFSTWDGSADITATTGHKIAVAVVTAGGYVVASGSATVTSKA